MARWFCLELLCASAVGCACQAGSSAPQGANTESSIAVALQPSASIVNGLPSSPSPQLSVRANCGLTTPAPVELMPVIHGKAVVRNNLGAVKLKGAPRLIAEPEDSAEYYMGESAVDPASLPATLKSLPGASLNVFTGPADCRPKLGKISALAWADEEGPGWTTSPSYNAQRAFRDGDSFLVAELESECDFSRGGLLTRSRIDGYQRWQKRSLLEEHDAAGEAERSAIIAKGVAALEKEPSLAVQNATYERFAKVHGLTLPKQWWDLPQSYVYWTTGTLGEAALLLVELQARALHGSDSFYGSWLGVWCVETEGNLVSLGPDIMPAEHSDQVTFYRHRVEFLGREGSLPVVLYSHFGLDPSSGRYVHFDHGIGPAPLIEEPVVP